jgi:hypothetical protein
MDFGEIGVFNDHHGGGNSQPPMKTENMANRIAIAAFCQAF